MRQAARDEADEAEDPDRFHREQEEASDESGRRKRTKGRGRGKGGKGGKGRGRGKAKAEPKVRSHTGKDMKEDSDREAVDEPGERKPGRKAQKKNKNNDESEIHASKNASPKTKRNRKDTMSPKVAESPFLKRAKTNREREREEKRIDLEASQPTTDANPKPRRKARSKLARQLEADFAEVADESGGGGAKPASPAKTPNSKRKKKENDLETQLHRKNQLCYDFFLISGTQGCYFASYMCMVYMLSMQKRDCQFRSVVSPFNLSNICLHLPRSALTMSLWMCSTRTHWHGA